MIIELASVGKTPKKVANVFTRDEIDLEGEAILTGEVLFEGSIHSDDRGVHLTGSIKCELGVDCVRCLEPVITAFDFEFEDLFVDESLEGTVDEAEVTGDALIESLVCDGAIDISEVVREQLLLELPEQVFCSEDCKGLCPKCGVNRNLIDCSCENKEIDPRWAALQNLN